MNYTEEDINIILSISAAHNAILDSIDKVKRHKKGIKLIMDYIFISNYREDITFSMDPAGKEVLKNLESKLKKAEKNISQQKQKLDESNFMKHLRTINKHKKIVLIHCIKAGIPIQGLLHDLSKYSPGEFYYGVKYYSGHRSPNEGERDDYGFSYAWMHHKGRNKHHFEYWTDYNLQANKVMPVKMPLKYVVEMFCDRVAAGKVYKGDDYTDASPYEYFDKGRARRTIHQETSDFLEKLLKMLAEKGEDYTFAYIRHYRKTHKDY